jgi:hypothetical protein
MITGFMKDEGLRHAVLRRISAEVKVGMSCLNAIGTLDVDIDTIGLLSLIPDMDPAARV